MDDRTELIVRLWNESRRYFRLCVTRERLLGPEDVDDLASEVMVAVIPRLGEIRQPERYVLRVSRNRVIREIKRRRREHVVENPGDLLDDARAPNAHQDEWEQKCTLTEHDHCVVQLARVMLLDEDCATRSMVEFRCASPTRTFEEISQTTGIASSALRMRMSRYAARVRSALPAENHAARVVVHGTKTR